MQTNVQCQSNMGTVSWDASFGAVGYVARLAGRDGHSLSCYTNDTLCYVEGLHCGVIYYTNAIAIGDTLNSSISTTVLLVSGIAQSYTRFISSKYDTELVLSHLIPFHYSQHVLLVFKVKPLEL